MIVVHQSRRRIRFVIAIMLLALASTMLFSLCLGRYPVTAATALRILASLVRGAAAGEHRAWTDTEFIVVTAVRLPRILVAVAAGFGLGLSGAALQGLFRNPLVGPQIIGISNGAAWGGVLAILLAAPPAGVVGSAFLFGMLALAAVFFLSRLSRGGTLAIVLAGVIVSAFFSALVGLAEFVADPERQLPGIVYWLLGSFANVSSRSVIVVGLPTAIAGTLVVLLRWRINLLSLGDADATALGVAAPRLRWLILLLVSLMVASQVAVSGAIGWVGLVIPHLARRLVGPDHRYLVPASGILGALYLLAIDDLARTLSAQEIPIGVLTALIGTPVFAFVFWRTQRGGWAND